MLGKDGAAHDCEEGEIRAEVEKDTEMGVQGAPTNQEKNISLGLYKGTEMSSPNGVGVKAAAVLSEKH